MFKAKLIENQKYYKLKSKQQILLLLPCFAIGLLVNFYTIPIWLTILMLVVYISATILMFKNQKKISSFLENKLIEIDLDEIRIKSKRGTAEETIKLNEVDKIILKDDYSIPQETMKAYQQELTGDTKQNFITVHQNNHARRFDFEIDSYYMISQLNKLIEKWKTNGYKIERIGQK